MTSPGGQEVGRVSIKVVPDLSDFRRDVKRELEEAESTLKLEVPVDLDMGEALAKIEVLKRELASINDEHVNVRVDVDADRIAKVRSEASKLERVVGSLTSRMRSAFGNRSRNDMNLFSRIAQTGLNGAASVMDAAAKGAASLASNIGESLQDGVKSLGSGILTLVGQMLLWIPLLSAAAGGILFLGGAITAAIGGLPVLLAGIGAPIAAVIIGFDGIGKAMDQLTPKFKQIQQNVSDTFEKRFTPIFKELGSVLPIVDKGMVGVANSVSDVAKKLVDVATSKKGLDDIRNAFAGIQTFVERLRDPLGRLLQVFLDIAGTRSYYEILSDTIGHLLDNFSRFVAKIDKNGDLGKGLVNLRDLVDQLSGAFFSLLQGALEFFNGASKGVNAFFGQLRNFFERIDWERLGEAFGQIFGAIGDWLQNLDPQTMKLFEDSFVRLADAIKDLLSGKSMDMLSAAFRVMLDTVTFLIQAFDWLLERLGDFADWIVSLPDKISNTFSGAGSLLFGSGSDLIGGLELGSQQKWTDFIGWLGGLKDDVVGFFTDAWNWLTGSGTGIIGGLSNGATQKFAEFAGWLGGVKDKVLNFFRDAWQWLVGSGNSLLGGFRDGASQGWINFIGWLGGIPNAIGSFFAGAGRWLWDAGKRIIDGLFDGLKSSWAQNSGWIGTLAGWIAQHKGPPSKDAKLLVNAGLLIMQGLFNGLRDGWGDVQKLLTSMTTEFSTFGNDTLAASVSFNNTDFSSSVSSQLEVASQLDSGGLEERIARALSGWSIDMNKYGVARLNKSAERDNRVGR